MFCDHVKDFQKIYQLLKVWYWSVKYLVWKWRYIYLHQIFCAKWQWEVLTERYQLASLMQAIGNWELVKSKRIELSHFYTNASWNGDKKKVAILFETKKYSPASECLVDCLRTEAYARMPLIYASMPLWWGMPQPISWGWHPHLVSVLAKEKLENWIFRKNQLRK